MRVTQVVSSVCLLTLCATSAVGSEGFAWRSYMLDVSRHFFTVKEIERTLDAMAVAGLNVFHWHLTDNTGWRLPVGAYPDLTGPRGASRRASTVRTSTMSKDDTDGTYGPFSYTKDEARHVVAYAAARGIEVVPEVDIPGHSRAAVRAYGSLGCVPGELSNQLCIGKDATLRMYEKIVDEVLELFPSEAIHLGGDECSHRNWKKCPDCQRRIKELGLRGEKGLQGWFMRHFAEYLERKGRRMVAWDDVVDFADLPKSVIVMAYRDRKNLGPVAARRGYDVVETSGYYFDYLQGLADDPYEYQPFGRNCSWRRIMTRDPAADYPGELRKRLKGVGCCMWTELVGDIAGVEWRTWPRAAALAQVLRDGPTDDAAAFAAKLSATSEKLRQLGVNVAPLGPYFREFPELEPGVRCLWLREETAKMLPNPLDESVLRFEGADAECPPDKVFAKRDAAYPEGAYLLDMDWMCVEVTASGSAGFRNALRQLGKLARRKKGGVMEFPSCRLAFGDVPDRPVAASEFTERTFTARSGRSVTCRLREPRHMMLGANYPLFVFNGVPEAKALAFVDRREKRNEEAFYCLLPAERTQEEIDGLCDEMAWTIRNLNGDCIRVLTAKDVEPKEYGYCDPFSPEDRRAVIDPAARGELRLSPLFASCGVVFGGCDVTNGLSVAWRKRGADAGWQRTELYWFADVANARGVIRGLDEDTEYEAQALCGDMVCAQGTFRTWTSDVPIARTVEIDPATARFPIVVSDRGTPTGWVRYVAKDGRPIVNREEAMTFVVTNAAYVVFDDLKIVGGRANRVFHLTDSTGVRIRHCDISGWGFKGVARFDDRGRVYERWDEKRKRYVGGDGQHAIFVDVGMKETVVERCWIHDPAGRSHAWRYSHPHGPMAMMMSRPDGATVVRWNDFVGSDLHRWDDGIGGNMNFWEDGGFNRNAEVYGNFICFANDDCIELDGGQQNVLCEGNRFEGAYMGVSVQGCVVSPSYVLDNLFSGMGDEFGSCCWALKPNSLDFHKRGAPICVFTGNTCWGPGRSFDPQRRAGPTGRFVLGGNRFPDGSEAVVPDYPRRPAGFLLDVARMDVGRDHSPRTIRVRLTGGATEIPYEIAKNDAFDWLQVTPARGVLKEGSELTVSFDEAKMRERPLYRGAFLVRTPEGLSRPVTVYASTDWTQPLKCDRPGEVAVYAFPKDATTDKDRYSVYTFDVPKAGRYYFMAFAQGAGRTEVSAAVDGNKPMPTAIQPGKDFPAWSIVPVGFKSGPSCHIRFYDFEPGRHTLRIKPWHGRYKLQAVVLTDSPGSFEPKLGGNACEALQVRHEGKGK